MAILRTMTNEDIEESADIIKVASVKSLVRDGIIDNDIADKWAATHCVILRKKTLFRTISTLWNKQEEIDGYYYLVVAVLSLED